MSIELNGTTGITTPGLTNTGTETIVNLTTTGNTILGNASTDTLNVGNGDLVKDASGNVGIGTSSPANPLEVNQGVSSSVAGIKVSGPTWTMLDLVTTNADSEARNWRLAGVLNSFGLFEIISGSTSGGAPNTTVLGLKKASSVALEGAIPQTGAGITFPATQSASTDANTLDDYEEGTWTPVLSATNPPTYVSTTVGTYTKIGNQVVVNAYISVASVSVAGSISCGFTGLPFACNGTAVRFSGVISNNTTYTTSHASSVYLIGGNTIGYFWDNSLRNNFNDGLAAGELWFTISYFI